MKQREKHLVEKVYANPRYRGKRVVLIHGEVYPTPSGTAGFRKLKKLLERYQGEIPTIVYVPKEESLILVLW